MAEIETLGSYWPVILKVVDPDEKNQLSQSEGRNSIGARALYDPGST
jgi:hypothetical protein